MIEIQQKEIWKPVVGFENRYQVSNIGRVKGLHRGKEIILKNQLHKTGYITLSFWVNGRPKVVKVHRLVANAHLPNPNQLPVINHINCIKTDNRVENLEWCTKERNTQLAHKTGLIKGCKGSTNGNSRLCEKDVAEIKYLLNEFVPGKQIAKLFGISKFAVYAIKIGKTWKHVNAKAS